jgi:hypothetical protein
MPETLTETEEEKQQYLEGPWERVSGPDPLTEFELEGWRDNLDKMYGAENWQAVPTDEQSKQFNIVASPDTDSVYAGMARSFDKKGTSDEPHIQEILAKRALDEHGPVQQSTTPTKPNRRHRTRGQEQDPTDPLGESPDFSNSTTIHNLLMRASGLSKDSTSPLVRTAVAGLSNVAEGLVSKDLSEKARAIRTVRRIVPALNAEGQETTFETTTYSPEEIKSGLARIMSGFNGEHGDNVRGRFGIPAPAEDNQAVATESVFKPEEETVALGLIDLGFSLSKNAEEQHKVLTTGFIYSEKHIDMFVQTLAKSGHLQGSPEEQAAMVSGVKEKLLTELQKTIQANEQIVNGSQKETPSGSKRNPGSESAPANRQESLLSDRERELYRKMAMLLANNLGVIYRPSPKQPSGMTESFSEVDQELVALQSEGQSEKKALHTLAKKYHSDVNHEPEAGEKMRVVTQRLEELNRRDSK